MQKKGIMCAGFAVLLTAGALSGCAGVKPSYTHSNEADGYHSRKTVCYKDKGCVVQDCITHYTALPAVEGKAK